MAKPLKIIFRTSALVGLAYLIFKNKDRIVGKFSKLAKMGDMDEVVDDLSVTADNLFENTISAIEDAYEYVVNLGDVPDGGFNKQYWDEINKEVKDLPTVNKSLLKGYATNIVSDIRNWSDSSIKYGKQGMMPSSAYIAWTTLFRLDSDDFNRVIKMVNTMLQYNYPNVKSDTVRDNNLPNILYYAKNPPLKYTSKNMVDWTGRKPIDGIKPKQLFPSVVNMLNNNSNWITGVRSGGGLTSVAFQSGYTKN